MKDAYTFIISGDSFKFGALPEDVVPRKTRHRKRDVLLDAKGKNGEPKPEPWEEWTARVLRQKD